MCRWDRVSLQRLLTKLVTAPTLLTSAPSVKGLSPLARALASMPDPDKEEKGVHPQHVCIQLDRESKSILGRASSLLLSHYSIDCLLQALAAHVAVSALSVSLLL